MGVAMLPLWVIHRDVKERHLSIITPASQPVLSKIALVRRKSVFIPRPVQAFIAIARELERQDLRLLTRAPARAARFTGSKRSFAPIE
jgi:DNA-binding transcriptional LysR family regulator